MHLTNVPAFVKRFLALMLVLLLLPVMSLTAAATEGGEEPYQEVEAEHRDAVFTYALFLTDQNGMPVSNPRTLKTGDSINVEIRLTREEFNAPNYDSYGIEFRLQTRGLTFNYDGVSLRSDTDVRLKEYFDGDVVGFAWYDMQRIGEKINNPVMAASWSYTVDDPKKVNITVPVALIYITGDDEAYVPVGTATLFLDANGGKIVGDDVSGTYPSGTSVVLPSAEMGEWEFAGWSDGAHLYPAGSEYAVSGIVTLTAEWKELVRDRHVRLDPKGGEIIGEDITGFYADGELLTLPDASREGYKFLGWDDGVNLYHAGAEYRVYNTVILAAQWEELPQEVPGETDDSSDPTEPTDPTTPDKPGIDAWKVGVPAGALGLGLFWWLILLWKRRFVKYSLVTGDVSLYYKNGKLPAEIDVVLYDGEAEYHLSKSGKVRKKHRLRFIKNVTEMAIADIKPGKYKGKLIIHLDTGDKVKKCRIKVLDRELNDKFKKK